MWPPSGSRVQKKDAVCNFTIDERDLMENKEEKTKFQIPFV